MSRLEKYLPSRLRGSGTNDKEALLEDINALLQDLRQAKKDLKHRFGEPVDILTYMVVVHGRYAAVLFLIDRLLDFATSGWSAAIEDALPSNVQWATPNMTLLSQRTGPLDLNFIKQHSISHASLEDRFRTVPHSGQQTAAVSHVWHFLGTIIIRSANSDVGYAQALMTIAYRVLAKIHHFNLVPKNVYTYSPTSLSTTLQRPPVLYLLSSRILTTLSDAVWRSSQDEALTEAARSGVPLKKLGLDPPGGRFRLKVRDLGPEAWLEFVLWCCVEGGHRTVGSDIIELIRRQTDNPWFAMSWAGSSSGKSLPAIDWDRVGMRTGGTVGRIEGYSNEKPLIQIPARTISVEVVLALAESLLTSHRALVQTDVAPLSTQISNLLGFLEPHGLPALYFDYLTVRLLQMEELEFADSPEALHTWFRTTSWLRSLETTRTRPAFAADFRYQSIVSHSELHAGISHQVLQAYLRAGFPIEAVEVFNDIQRLVDNSKMQAISSFINKPLNPVGGFFDARTTKRALDFVDSHGQLPMPRVVAFMNMVTENNLVALGEWMIYSDDVDGPIISKGWYGHTSVATALIRYSGVTLDTTMLQHVLRESQHQRMRPTVKSLRTRFNTCVRQLRIEEARRILKRLCNALAGGYSPDNLASLAVAVMFLDSKALKDSRMLTDQLVTDKKHEVILLLQDLLDHKFDESRGSFTVEQVTLFRQQIGHLLRIFDNVSDASLNELAFTYMPSYPSGNQANLKPDTFDIILKGIVQYKSAVEGRQMWKLFCKTPQAASNADESPHLRDYYVPAYTVVDDEEMDGESLEIDESNISETETPSLDSVYAEDLVPTVDETPPMPEADIIYEAAPHRSPFFLMPRKPRVREQPTPLVVASIKTLRIILRGAISQQRDLKLYRERKTYQSVIRWVRETFQAFRDTAGIEREMQAVQMNMEDSDIDEESADLAEFARSTERNVISVSKEFSPRGFVTKLPFKVTGIELPSHASYKRVEKEVEEKTRRIE